MLRIEEYIARRKQEDRMNEFDLDERTQNMKSCVDYVFEYFNDYLYISEVDEKTILHSNKLEKYRQQLEAYEPDVQEWAVRLYDEYGKQVHKYIGNYLKLEELFFLYSTDAEFRGVSYDCYTKLIKKLPFLKDQTEMLFLFIKEHHRVQSQKRLQWGMPLITEELTQWLEQTWSKHQVNLAAFAYDWIERFYDSEEVWPASHRKKSRVAYRKYDYDYKQKSNLFNLNTLYRKMPKKSFIRGRKQFFETLFMYYWLHEMESDDEYWQEYINNVEPFLVK